MTTETISSNVVNYLVWRYLQEAGYGKAALSLARNWNPNPDSLPFAKNVEPHTLRYMIQDGLWLDRLQADVQKTAPRYRFGQDHGLPYSTPDGDDAADKDERRDQAPRRERETNGNVMDVPPTAGAKRKRKSTGTEPERHTNGEVMEIVSNGVPPTNHMDTDAIMSDAGSPIVEEVPLPSTLSVGHSMEVQYNLEAELEAQRVAWKAKLLATSLPATRILMNDRSGVSLEHMEWNPEESQLIVVAGESLMRLFFVPSRYHPHMPLTDPLSNDVDLGSGRFMITSLCWTHPGEMMFGLLDGVPDDDGNVSNNKGALISVRDNGTVKSTIAEEVGTVVALRWNPVLQMLLSVSSTDTDSTICLWKDGTAQAQFTTRTAQPLYTAEWMTNGRFIVGGDGILEIYEVTSELRLYKEFTSSAVRSRVWEKLRYDPELGRIALVTSGNLELWIWEGIEDEEPIPFASGPFTALSFETSKVPSQQARLVAVSGSEEDAGAIRIFNIRQEPGDIDTYQTLQLDEDNTVAEDVAFSPDGAFLAAAGLDTVVVWSTKTWKKKATWLRDGSHGALSADSPLNRDTELDIELKWDPDGKLLALKTGSQVVIIDITTLMRIS